MIDDQLEAYPGHEGFLHAILGLRSACESFVGALQIERQDGAGEVDGPLVDFALGVVSLTRSLQATLSTIPSPTVKPASPESNALADSPRWLR